MITYLSTLPTFNEMVTSPNNQFPRCNDGYQMKDGSIAYCRDGVIKKDGFPQCFKKEEDDNDE